MSIPSLESHSASAPARWWASRAMRWAALLAWLLATAGLRPLLVPDEARYAGVAYDMLQRGDWLVPTLHGLPFFHKPPLMYWIDLLAFQAFGIHEIAARAASLVGAGLMALALEAELRASVGERFAAFGLAVLATTPFYFFAAQFANHDMLVAGCVSLAVVAARRGLDPLSPGRAWIRVAWAAAAFGVLAKGLIGIVLPGLVLLPVLLWRRRWADLLRLLDPAGIAIFVAIGLPWFVLMQWRYPGFFDYFIVEQHVRRYAAGGFNNAMPIWFYWVLLPLVLLPWSLWLPALLRRRPAEPAGSDAVFHAWWLIAVLVFFSLPASKLAGYVLPVLVPSAVLLSAAAARSRWRLATGVAAAAVCLVAVGAVAWRTPRAVESIAAELRLRLPPGEQVVVVELPLNALAFHARLARAPAVLSNWDDPAIAQRDDWRRELSDAGRFDPAAAADTLLTPQRFTALRCAGQARWLVAPSSWQPPAAYGTFQRVAAAGELALWQATAAPADCR